MDALEYAKVQIENLQGVRCDLGSKSIGLLKFGRNTDIDTGATETIQSLGGHETFVTSNAIETVSSSNAGDTQVVQIEGFTVTGTGTSSVFTPVTQTITLTGQTKATLGTPLARVVRAYNTSSTSLAGDVYVYEDTAIVTGVPSDLTKAHIKIEGSTGDNQTFKASTTVGANEAMIITSVYASVTKKVAGSADMTLQVREAGSVFREKLEFTVIQNGGVAQVKLEPYLVVPPNADVRIIADVSANNLHVNAGWTAYMAAVW